MSVDRTDPYDLREWLRGRYQRIGFHDDFLAATKGMPPATEAQFEWYLEQGLEDIVELTAGLVKGRGRPWKRMMRVVVAWCITEGWWPHDQYITDADADVQLLFSQTGRDARPEVIKRVALDVARARRRLDDGRTTFELYSNRRHLSLPQSPHAECFDVRDDQGVDWRIWSTERQGVALLLDDLDEADEPSTPCAEPSTQQSADSEVIDLNAWREARGGSGGTQEGMS